MRFIIVIVGAVVIASPVIAQAGLKPRQMVRIELKSGQAYRGKVLRPMPDSLIFSDYTRVISVPAPEIYSVATYEKHYWRGAVRGAKVGAIVGGVLIAVGLVSDLTYCRKPSSECMMPATFVGIGGAFWTTGVGAGIGLLAAPGGWTNPRSYSGGGGR